MKVEPPRIVAAEFVAGAALGSALPASGAPEIAFAGRSNVGKSSLINALVDRKSLVRTSSQPGSTRQINLFEARAADGATFRLVDLPGYGFTRRSKSERIEWGKLVEGFLRTRETLAAVVLLADVRRGLEDDDRELLEFLAASERKVEVIIVATKIDKLAKSERKVALSAFAKNAKSAAIGFSAETGEGKSALWTAIRRITVEARETEV